MTNQFPVTNAETPVRAAAMMSLFGLDHSLVIRASSLVIRNFDHRVSRFQRHFRQMT
jgi:hypothetical protein